MIKVAFWERNLPINSLMPPHYSFLEKYYSSYGGDSAAAGLLLELESPVHAVWNRGGYSQS